MARVFNDGSSFWFGDNTSTYGFELDAENNVAYVVSAAPAISAGFGHSPSIVHSGGAAAFTLDVGTGGAATSGTIGLPAARSGWACSATDLTTAGASFTKQTATTPTSATLTNYNQLGIATPWKAGDILSVSCSPY